MVFNYESIRIGDLDVEYNYINFGAECDGDNQVIIMEAKDDTE